MNPRRRVQHKAEDTIAYLALAAAQAGGAVPGVFNIQTYGADPTGVRDSSVAVQSALTAGAAYSLASGQQAFIYVPPGTYSLATQLNYTNTIGATFYGGGTLKATAATTYILLFSGGPAGDVTFNGVNFNGGDLTSAAVNTGFQTYASVTFIGCTFSHFPGQTLQLTMGRSFYIERCYFDGRGKGVMQAINFSGSMDSITIYKCRFRGCYSGVVIAGTGLGGNTHTAEDFLFEGNYFDGMYYTLPPITLSNGAKFSLTGTFTGGTQLIDPNVDFTGYAGFGEIRVMATIATGTVGGGSSLTQLSDASATFTSDTFYEGDIIRTNSGAFGIIKGVDSDTLLNIEEWLDDTTREPTPAPIGSTYTLYSVRISKITSISDAHHATVYFYWSDMQGNIYDGAGGSGHKPVITADTRYEICPLVSYPIQCNADIRRVKVVHSTFRRGWTDQVSTFGDECIVAHNFILDGQDEGVTIDESVAGQGHHIVCDNYIYRQGASGVAVGGDNAIVHDNQIIGWGKRDAGAVAAIELTGASGMVHHNHMDAQSQGLAFMGIEMGVLATTNTEVKDNTVINLNGSPTDIRVVGGSGTTGNIIIHDGIAPVYFDNGSGVPAGQYSPRLQGSASPAASVVAGVGSVFIDSTNGFMYIKHSGTDSSGWLKVTAA